MRAPRFLAIAASLLCSAPALAQCYDEIGCTDQHRFDLRSLMEFPDCQMLWQIRNQMYREHGYCFRTERGITAFGNTGCQYDDVNNLPLSRIEAANVTAVQQIERIKGCPR